MKSSTRNRAKGLAKEAKGRLKAKVGRLAHKPRLVREGQDEATRGRLRREFGELQRDLEEAASP